MRYRGLFFWWLLLIAIDEFVMLTRAGALSRAAYLDFAIELGVCLVYGLVKFQVWLLGEVDIYHHGEILGLR